MLFLLQGICDAKDQTLSEFSASLFHRQLVGDLFGDVRGDFGLAVDCEDLSSRLFHGFDFDSSLARDQISLAQAKLTEGLTHNLDIWSTRRACRIDERKFESLEKPSELGLCRPVGQGLPDVSFDDCDRYRRKRFAFDKDLEGVEKGLSVFFSGNKEICALFLDDFGDLVSDRPACVGVVRSYGE